MSEPTSEPTTATEPTETTPAVPTEATAEPRFTVRRRAHKAYTGQTFVPKGPLPEPDRKWFLVDATGLTVGRLASQIAPILMGKHHPRYTTFMDMGDGVIIINAEKVVFRGNKWDQKLYRRHSGYPGGLREIKAKDLLVRFPDRILQHAIVGMLPKTKLGRQMAKKLRIYAGPNHPHRAQQPEMLKLDTLRAS
ncbi:MAG: 50S ribosomal protein L13 [Chloracidobacterium sp.]|uniref:Large ribosomal subunit protein uL13 n=1 Tax=Chloracidobacterium validum TaxID=2821543 RepID=A0ABX8BA10_9BACT|nr:50S ribosomal protein L13 [Chloracidobacterium validum]